MPLLVVGLNHRTSPVGLLERLSVGADELPEALDALAKREHVLEGAVLSTCNRVEVYAAVSRFHGGAQDLRQFLSDFRGVAPDDFADHVYTYHDEGAVSHLFRVAAGIDSLVVGETEILGQVRRAFAAAEDRGTLGRLLRRAFTEALRVGKRARSETGISRNPASVSSAAVELARQAFAGGSLQGLTVAVVGAGKMGRLAVEALERAGARRTVVVNRSEERARDLAEAFGVEPRPLSDLPEILAGADIVICSTTAPRVVLDRPLVEAAAAGRDRPLLIVDIAVPRDVDPAVADLPGVVLRDIDALRSLVESSLGERAGEVAAVEAIVAEETERFSRWERALEVAPVLAQLTAKAEHIRSAELDRLRASFDDEQWEALEQATRRIVGKLLHSPLQRSKELAASGSGHVYVEALCELFELDDDPSS